MRTWLIVLLALSLTHCSCQRQADPAEPMPALSPSTDSANAGTGPAGEDIAAPSSQTRAARTGSTLAAVSALHAYLAALPGSDHGRADAYWANGTPGPSPGDAILRGRTDLQDLRIHTAVPTPLDTESPPRALQIPVELRLRTSDGMQRIDGWYRLRLHIDGQSWEITSASLQPRLG